MNIMSLNLLLLFPVLFLSACAITEDVKEQKKLPCSPEWYQSADKKLSITDEDGHGPDLGSLEWRSAVEFKLDLKNVSDKPEKSSTQWCKFIDKNM